jgi:hypothetical protein
MLYLQQQREILLQQRGVLSLRAADTAAPIVCPMLLQEKIHLPPPQILQNPQKSIAAIAATQSFAPLSQRSESGRRAVTSRRREERLGVRATNQIQREFSSKVAIATQE